MSPSVARVRNVTIVAVIMMVVVSVMWMAVASRASAPSATPVVYVATGENFPDALGAGPAAAIVKGPILLVSQNSIPGETAAELTRLSPDKIVIVGGTAVVSPSVESALAAYAGTVERIAGANRYDTAAKLSAATFPATIDADTLNGLSSSAFLGRTAKAADAYKLDGLDSSAFLRANGVVMTSGAMNWQPNQNGPTIFARAATRVQANDGLIVMSIAGPSSIGVTNFGLHQINFCITGGAGVVDNITVYRLVGTDTQSVAIDSTDRGVGCHEIVVDASVGSGATVAARVKGGIVYIGGIESTWTTNAYTAAGVTDVDSSDPNVNP